MALSSGPQPITELVAAVAVEQVSRQALSRDHIALRGKALAQAWALRDRGRLSRS